MCIRQFKNRRNNFLMGKTLSCISIVCNILYIIRVTPLSALSIDYDIPTRSLPLGKLSLYGNAWFIKHFSMIIENLDKKI